MEIVSGLYLETTSITGTGSSLTNLENASATFLNDRPRKYMY